MARTGARPKRKTTRIAGPRPRQRRRPSSGSNDGGAWSLAGYIYQLLGSSAERVRLAEPPSAPPGEASVRLFLEQHGQDAAVDDGRTTRLVQFKYSQSARPIQPAELAEILVALEKSSKQVARSAAVPWQLVTNRPPSPLAERSLRLAGRTIASRRRRASRSRKESTAQVIARLGHRLDVLRRDLDEFQSSLHSAAAAFGVADDGVAGRVLDLLQTIAVKAPERREVSLEALRRALAGYPHPRSVRLADCRGDLRSALESAARVRGGLVPLDIVERRGLNALLAQRAALAIVYGPGGCGKTLSLFKALDRRLSDGVGLAGMIVKSPRDLSHVLDSWRNARSAGESPTEALRRLRTANPDAGYPVLVLGLDGLDEVPETERREAEDLIRDFHEMHVNLHRSQLEPDGLLVVTCRDKEDLNHVVAPLGPGGTPPPEVPSLKIEEFSDEEFAAVWAIWFRDETLPRLGSLDEMLATVADAVAAPDRRLLALRHPVLLGCTKSLSKEERQLLYRGDSSVWSQVLVSYFDWFTKKTCRRAGCHPRAVRGVLTAAARATASAPLGAFDREGDWVTPAARETGQAPDLVRQIFDDAVTTGVVIAGPTKYTQPVRLPVEWRWRFPELAAHLASLA